MKRVPTVTTPLGLQETFFRLLDRGRLLFMHRLFIPRKAASFVNVYGSRWCLVMGDIAPGNVRIRHGDEYFEACGKLATFVPPFTLMEWHIGMAPLEFVSLVSTAEVPGHLPARATVFDACPGEPLQTVGAVFDWLRQARPHALVGRQDHPSALARKTKEYIDRHFTDELKIQEVARVLQLSHEVMTRSFTDSYGITPVVYRNKLRIFESLCRMVTGAEGSVTSAAHNVGFQDLSRFNVQFKRELRDVPRHFLDTKISQKTQS